MLGRILGAGILTALLHALVAGCHPRPQQAAPTSAVARLSCAANLGFDIGFAEERNSRSATSLRLWRGASASGVVETIQLTATDTSLVVDLGPRTGIGPIRPDARRVAERMREQCGRTT